MKRAAPPLPSKQYMRDFRWIVSHINELVREYPNQWVAVHRGKVVATGDKLGQVESAALKLVGDEEFPVYFVDDGTIILNA